MAIYYRIKRGLILILLGLVCFTSNVAADEKVSHPKSWKGCYPDDEGGCKVDRNLIELPEVKRNLKAILKKDEYRLWTHTYAVEGGTTEADHYQITERFRPHSSGELALLLIGLKEKNILVIFYLSYSERDDLQNTTCVSNGKQVSELSDDLKEEILVELQGREDKNDRLLPKNPWINKVPCRVGKK